MRLVLGKGRQLNAATVELKSLISQISRDEPDCLQM